MGRGLSRSRYEESHAENSDDRGLQRGLDRIRRWIRRLRQRADLAQNPPRRNGSGCSQTGRIGLGIFFFTRRRTVKTQQMTKYILGGVIAVGLIFFCASSNAQAKEKKMNEALTINGDGAQCNPDIHWPQRAAPGRR